MFPCNVPRHDMARYKSSLYYYYYYLLDASQAIFEPPPENWRRPLGRPRTTWMNIHDDLSLLDLGIHEAGDLVHNQPLCRLVSLHSAAHS